MGTSGQIDPIFVSTADGSVLNTATETSIIGTGVGSLTLPANFFLRRVSL